jgi:hypothetical protein
MIKKGLKKLSKIFWKNRKRNGERRKIRVDVGYERRMEEFVYESETVTDAAKDLGLTKHDLEKRIEEDQ